MSEDIGYIKGKVEGIEDNIGHMRDNQTKLFDKFEGVESLLKEMPCNGHANDIKLLKTETSANRARSHGAAEMATDIKIKVRPILEERKAAELEEVKTEERKWYQKAEIRIYIVGGTALCLIQWLPDLARYLIKLFKG